MQEVIDGMTRHHELDRIQQGLKCPETEINIGLETIAHCV